MAMPNEEGAQIVKKLLDSGADPWIKTNEGKLPFDIGLLHGGMAGARAIRRERMLNAKLEERGMTKEDAFKKHPQLRMLTEEFQRAPSFVDKTMADLMDAMKRTKP